MIGKNFIQIILFSGVIFGCTKNKDQTSYLKLVLNNLEHINTATYYTKAEAYAPGDTTAYFTNFSYYKEFINPSDTFVGASFLRLMPEDTTSLLSCWDGHRKITVYHDHNGILIDSFKNDPRPFRVVNSPFFTKTKRLIRYVLETEDSIKIDFKEIGDSLQCNISIYDTIVEVIGNRMIYNSPQAGIQKGSVSKYRIWINKSSGLPYRFERDMPHDKSTLECSNVKFNIGKLENFNAAEYFPADYEIREFIRGTRVSTKSQLEGKPAPDWILHDINNDKLALNSLKGKVVMIQFTSVSCGPCQASVPFLNLLQSEFDKNQFGFVAIEAYNQNSNVLKNYRHRTNMTYRFLMSSIEVTKSYQIEAVPTFFILDEDRVIRKVIKGYRIGSTDSMIRQSINSLL